MRKKCFKPEVTTERTSGMVVEGRVTESNTTWFWADNNTLITESVWLDRPVVHRSFLSFQQTKKTNKTCSQKFKLVYESETKTKRRRNQIGVPRTDPSIFIEQNRIYKSNRRSIYKNSKIYARVKQSEREREKDTLRLTVQLLLQARAMAIRRLKEEEDGSSERMMKGVWVVLLD